MRAYFSREYVDPIACNSHALYVSAFVTLKGSWELRNGNLHTSRTQYDNMNINSGFEMYFCSSLKDGFRHWANSNYVRAFIILAIDTLVLLQGIYSRAHFHQCENFDDKMSSSFKNRVAFAKAL